MGNDETAGAPEVAPTVQCPNCGYGVAIPQEIAPDSRGTETRERVTPLPELADK